MTIELALKQNKIQPTYTHPLQKPVIMYRLPILCQKHEKMCIYWLRETNTNHAFEKLAFCRKQIEFLGAPETTAFGVMTKYTLAREEPGYHTLPSLLSLCDYHDLLSYFCRPAGTCPVPTLPKQCHFLCQRGINDLQEEYVE